MVLSLLEKKLYFADVVIFHSRWQSKNVIYLKDFIGFCSKHSEKKCPLIVIGSRVEWVHVPTMVSKMHSRFEVNSVNSVAYSKKYISYYLEHRDALMRRAEELSIPHVDLVSIMCDDSEAQCRVLDDQKNILIYDHGHWTISGQDYYGEMIANSTDFQLALRSVLN